MPKEKQQINALKPKQCPNCDEPNRPDSKFCASCRMVLAYDAYSETLEKEQQRESEVQNLKLKYEGDIKAMREEMQRKFQQIWSLSVAKSILSFMKCRQNTYRDHFFVVLK